MSETMRIENWCGHEIRFIERDGEWWAILKDICDALVFVEEDVVRHFNGETEFELLIDLPEMNAMGIDYVGILELLYLVIPYPERMYRHRELMTIFDNLK